MNLTFLSQVFFPIPLLVPLTSASPTSSLLSLSNTTIAVSNARDTFCFRNAAWTKPHWDANVEEPCRLIINHLLAQYVVPDQFAEFEFLPLGQAQVTAWGAVRTPFKLVMGNLWPIPWLSSSSSAIVFSWAGSLFSLSTSFNIAAGGLFPLVSHTDCLRVGGGFR